MLSIIKFYLGPTRTHSWSAHGVQYQGPRPAGMLSQSPRPAGADLGFRPGGGARFLGTNSFSEI